MGTFSATGAAVADLERATAFYVDVFGMRKQQTYDLPHMVEHILGFGRRGEAALVLMEYKGRERPQHDPEATKFVFYVRDAAATAAAVTAAGGVVTTEPTEAAGMGGAVVGFAQDLDGYVLELLQLPARAAE